jgi:hypothetical protein
MRGGEGEEYGCEREKKEGRVREAERSGIYVRKGEER